MKVRRLSEWGRSVRRNMMTSLWHVQRQYYRSRMRWPAPHGSMPRNSVHTIIDAFARIFRLPSPHLFVEFERGPERFRKAALRTLHAANEAATDATDCEGADMPADHESGRFALLMNAWSRRAFPLGTTAALSLMISTAAHAEQCFDTRSSRPMVVAQAATVPPASACILDESTMRRTSAICRASVRQDASGTPALPAQQPVTR
jgi:hypothetical protein